MGRGQRIDLTGQRFSRWTVISRQGSDKDYNALYLCRCDCGTEKIVYAAALRSGDSSSCGCYSVERSSEVNATHGQTRGRIRSSLYSRWVSAVGRCENPKHKRYKDWGGRGVKMCAGWREDFGSFYKDMGDPPPGLMIDRINNDGHYSCGHCYECQKFGWPANCRWVTPKESMQNRRPNKPAI